MTLPAAGTPGFGWAIRFEGKLYREGDLSLYAASQALKVAGGGWTDLHPLRSPDHLCGLLAAFLEADGEPFADACVRVAALDMVEALQLVEAV